jgi:hypothetical protein
VDQESLSVQLGMMATPEFPAWLESMRQIKGCADPVYLVGHTITRDAQGGVTHVFTSRDQPNKRLAVPCGNRRSSRCEPCAYLHAGDTYQIIVTGLSGGKDVEPLVAGHPRVFLTLTAPGFGAVHRVGDGRGPCRRRGKVAWCAHGVSRGCVKVHEAGDPWVGQALCEECYAFTRAVIWNANVGKLWHWFVMRVRRELAAAGGVIKSDLGKHAKVVFAKVIEYQARGSIHIHAVVRVDGPDGPGDPAPEWVTGGVLAEAVRVAASRTHVTWERENGEMGVLVFGTQFDVQPIVSGPGGSISDRAVASYIAKYVTKGEIPGLTWDRRITSAEQIEHLELGRQGRMLMRAAWDLGGRARAWTHQLGFPGHVTTKSPTYSTTYGALREARREFRRQAAGVVAEPGQSTQSEWEYAGHGLTPGEALFVRGISREVMDARRGIEEEMP